MIQKTGVKVCDTCTQVSQVNPRPSPVHLLLSTPGNFVPSDRGCPIGEALTEVLAGSGQYLRMRELETSAPGKRKGKN